MSVKTIECRIAAKPESLKYLWELMTLKNTPLINELLAQVPNHPDFEEWFEKGTLPQKTIKELCVPLRKKEPFANQPGRFYSSAIALVHYMFKSWLKVQKKLRQRIEGKQRWLAMLKSDRELEDESGKDLEEIRLLALKIEQQLDNQKVNSKKKRKKQKKTKSKTKNSTIQDNLIGFDVFWKIKNLKRKANKIKKRDLEKAKYPAHCLA